MLKVGEAVDRYIVEAHIGSGGLAEVYRVRHARLGSVHALKVMKLGGRKLAARFVQEGQIQSRLSHPGLVRVSDVVEHEGRAALLMELVEGESLEDRLLREGALPLPLALDLFSQVLRAVAVAHAAGVLHRDLKPPNILLTGPAAAPVAKVTDFGIARSFGGEASGATRSGDLIGTPGYMAPEQVDDPTDVDGRADLFSLGAVLYAMLTAQTPFPGTTVAEVLTASGQGRFTPLVTLRPELPAAVIELVERLLRPLREERFADATAALAAVEALRAHSPMPGAPTAVPATLHLDYAAGLPTPQPAPSSGLRWAVGLAAVLVLGALAAAWWATRTTAETETVTVQPEPAAPVDPVAADPVAADPVAADPVAEPVAADPVAADPVAAPPVTPSAPSKSPAKETVAAPSPPPESAPTTQPSPPAPADPAPAEAVVEPIPAPAVAAAPAPPEAAPDLSGAWSGRVGGQTLNLRLRGGGASLQGELDLVVGGNHRLVQLRGQQQGDRFTLAEEGDGQLWLEGSRSATGLEGTLQLGAKGKRQSWSARAAR